MLLNESFISLESYKYVEDSDYEALGDGPSITTHAESVKM
jgi:hypothetical protein